ncbi:MAG: hypothetical protein J3R72DRAFT_100052 [Linnemannia gamsii]|nr:MAG: hypothetical protein J3R72DRAFT_100052 [Linnemannia gamsii]
MAWMFQPLPLQPGLFFDVSSMEQSGEAFFILIFTPFVLVRVGSAAVLAVHQYGYGPSASARSLSATGYVHCRVSDASQVWSRAGSYSFSYYSFLSILIFTPFVLVRVGSAAVLAVRQYGYGLSASARSLSATGYVHCRVSDASQVWSRAGSCYFYFIFIFVLILHLSCL